MGSKQCFQFFHLLINLLFFVPFTIWVVTGEHALVLWLVSMIVVKLIAHTEEEYLKNNKRS